MPEKSEKNTAAGGCHRRSDPVSSRPVRLLNYFNKVCACCFVLHINELRICCVIMLSHVNIVRKFAF